MKDQSVLATIIVDRSKEKPTILDIAILDLLKHLRPYICVAFFVRGHGGWLEVNDLSNPADWCHCYKDFVCV